MKDRIRVVNWFIFSLFACVPLGVGLTANAQSDPGPRPGPADAGGPIKGLSAEEDKLFWASWERFKEVYSVSGTIEKGVGLGPTFNGNGCAQCIFLLHDGRTSDLLVAIQAHSSTNKDCRPKSHSTAPELCNSEANAVIHQFQALSPSQKQDILNFLRSL